MDIDINRVLEEIEERITKSEKTTKKFIKKHNKQMEKINALVHAITTQNRINRAKLDVQILPMHHVDIEKPEEKLYESMKSSINENQTDPRLQQMSKEKATRKSSFNIRDIMSTTAASIQESLKNPVEINETPYVDPIVPGERLKSDAELQKEQDDLMVTLKEAVNKAAAASKELPQEIQESWEDDEE